MAARIEHSHLKELFEESYDDVRKQIKTGDLLFASGEYGISHAIRSMTQSPWSHVGYLVVLKELDRVLVMESVKGYGVRVMPLSNYLERYDSKGPYEGILVVAKFRQPANFSLLNAVNWGLEQIPSSYDTDNLPRGALKIVSGEGRREDDFEWDCSEYVGAILERGNYRAPYDPRGFISPESIWNDDGMEFLARIM